MNCFAGKNQIVFVCPDDISGKSTNDSHDDRIGVISYCDWVNTFWKKVFDAGSEVKVMQLIHFLREKNENKK